MSIDEPGVWKARHSPAVALVLILLIEGLIGCNGDPGVRRPLGTHDSVWQANEDILARTGDVAVLFLGDSTMRVAISEPLFHEITGRKCLDLGLTSALALYGDLAMLERYLAAHPPPAALVVGHAIDGWTRPLDLAAFAFTRPSPRRIARALGARGSTPERSLPLLHEPLELAGRLLRVASIHIPSVRLRERLRRPWLPPLEPMESADPAWPSRDQERAAIRAAVEAVPLPYRVATESEAWLRELAALARMHRIPLYLVHSPLHVAVLEEPRGRELVAAASAELERLAREIEGVHLLGSEHPTFGWDEGSGDKDHVGATGVPVITRKFAALLMPVLGAGFR